MANLKMRYFVIILNMGKNKYKTVPVNVICILRTVVI